jgi:DNA adenine methylase
MKRPNELIRMAERWNPNVQDFFTFRREFLDGLKPSKPLDVETAFKKLVMHCCSFSGLGVMSYGPVGGKTQTTEDGTDKNYQIDQPWSTHNIKRQVKIIARLMTLHTLKHGECTSLDFEEVIRAEGDAVFYLDPPYVAAGKRLYEHAFKEADHRRLAEALKSRDKWLLSYDDHPLVRELFNGCYVYPVSLRHQIPGTSEGMELLISPEPHPIMQPIERLPIRTKIPVD